MDVHFSSGPFKNPGYGKMTLFKQGLAGGAAALPVGFSVPGWMLGIAPGTTVYIHELVFSPVVDDRVDPLSSVKTLFAEGTGMPVICFIIKTIGVRLGTLLCIFRPQARNDEGQQDCEEKNNNQNFRKHLGTALSIWSQAMLSYILHLMAILYMVATPVGNLQDMTFRGVEILKGVDIIACEDTRQSAKLLNHYGIQKHLISCRARNEKQSAPGIVKLLDEGKNIAYVSDAGTPVLSDPGRLLVRQCRDAGHDIIPIPGASAFSTLVSVCGFHGKSFHFEGFLSPKSGKRKKRLQELLEREESFMIYESPYRVIKVLSEIGEMKPEREILLGREMTKKFEEYIEGTADKLIIHLETGNHSKGEFALLVSAEKKG